MAQQVCEVVLGVTEPIGGEHWNSSGTLVTGSTTLVLSIRRASDGYKLDFSDSAFKASPTTGTAALTETPASSGFYVYLLNTALLAAGQSYLVRVEDTSSGALLDGLGGELRVRGVQTLVSTGATASGVASAVAPLATSAEVAALPTAAGITTAVWAAGTRTLTAGAITSTTIADDAITASKIAANAIGSSQIAASAVAEIQGGLATDSALATAQAALDAIKGTSFDAATDSLRALRARGDSAWVTATGFAVPGSAMALTVGERSSVGTAVWATATRSLTGSVSIANGAIGAASFATGAIDANAFAQGAADKAWSSSSRTLSAGVTLASGAITSTALDSTALAAITGDIWSELLASYTSGQAGYLLANAGGGAADPAVIAAAVVAQSIAGSSAGTVGAALSRVDVATSTLATAADLSTAQNALTAIQGTSFASGTDSLRALRARGDAAWVTATGFAVPGSAMTLATDAIGSSQIASSAVTELQNGLATALAVSALQSAVDALPSAADVSVQVAEDLALAHGAGAWITATGFAQPGDAMALTTGERSAVGTAVWATAARTLTTLGTGTITSGTLAASAVSAIQGGLATASALATAQSTIEALPSSRDISAEVVADLSAALSAAHGSGAWTTASTAGLATSSAVAQVQADVTAMKGVGFATGDDLHNVRLAVAAIPSAPSASTVAAAVVAQAIAGASAGTVGAALATASGYTIPTTSQITTALWEADLSAYGTYAQVAKAGGVLYGLKIVALNRMVEVAGNPGVITIYRDGGVTPYCTLQLRDAAGGAVTASTGDPAQRAAAT